jgi:hypothetical protein
MLFQKPVVCWLETLLGEHLSGAQAIITRVDGVQIRHQRCLHSSSVFYCSCPAELIATVAKANALLLATTAVQDV